MGINGLPHDLGLAANRTLDRELGAVDEVVSHHLGGHDFDGAVVTGLQAQWTFYQVLVEIYTHHVGFAIVRTVDFVVLAGFQVSLLLMLLLILLLMLLLVSLLVLIGVVREGERENCKETTD
jgi:hypothetical protein